MPLITRGAVCAVALNPCVYITSLHEVMQEVF
nr:MAG TPA: hypothetical protein [Caudoviricetes sp.]